MKILDYKFAMATNPNKKIYGLPEKQYLQLLDDLDKKQFEIKATNSLIWWLSSQEVYRASEILAAIAIDANNKSRLRSLREFEKNKDKGNYSRQITVEEYIENIDSSQIKIAFFLLGRALELLLKAILIEMNPKTFYNEIKKYQLKFENDGHNIFKMMMEAGINLTEDAKNNLKLLQHYQYIGTYPIPISVNSIIEKRKLTEELNKTLHHRNYEEISALFDLALTKYNELLKSNNKTERINHFKIKKNYF